MPFGPVVQLTTEGATVGVAQVLAGTVSATVSVTGVGGGWPWGHVESQVTGGGGPRATTAVKLHRVSVLLWSYEVRQFQTTYTLNETPRFTMLNIILGNDMLRTCLREYAKLGQMDVN